MTTLGQQVKLSSVFKLLTTLVLVTALGACSSKKKEEEAPAPVAAAAPAIDNTAMNFDPAGSDSGKINGLYSVNFDYDKSNLTPDAKQKLQKNVEWMKTNGNVKMQVEGHCDSRGTIEYNLALGERRAKAVKEYMKGLGVTEERMSIISYGKEKPLSMGDSDADHAKNRRANFVPLAQ